MRKFIMILAAGLALVGVVAALASAEKSENVWKPAGKQFKIQSNDSVFTAASNTVACKPFELTGTTPAGNGKEFTETEAQAGVNVTPSVGQCSPVTPTFNGTWKVALHSTNSKAQCEASEDDPNPEDDCVSITYPNEGAKINFGLCEVKLNAHTVSAVYDDDFVLQNGQTVGRATVNTKLPVTGCGVTEAEFKGTFVVAGLSKEETGGTKVQSGVTDD